MFDAGATQSYPDLYDKLASNMKRNELVSILLSKKFISLNDFDTVSIFRFL
jgi:hypothetical protein